MQIKSITLDKHMQTNIYGDLYGISYEKQGQDFTVQVFIDCFNQRIKVVDYLGPNIAGLTEFLTYLAEANHFGKVILQARAADWEEFVAQGYVLEGKINGYFQGQPGYCISKFITAQRSQSDLVKQEDEIIQQVQGQPLLTTIHPLPETYQLRDAQVSDIPALVELYRQVFVTYPSPMHDASYIQLAMHKAVHFKVIVHNGRIISAASADIDYTNLCAEMTDCATLPDYRGQGLMSHLMVALEATMRQNGLKTLFSLARARSIGISLVFHKHGYSYGGRLKNNCDICGQYEDMNIWEKQL